MRCPYCKKILGTYDIAYENIAENDCSIIRYKDGTYHLDWTYDPDFVAELGYYCVNCGGFLTTDETEAEKILKDDTDEIYQVKQEEKQKVADRIIEELEKQKILKEVFNKLKEKMENR